LRLLSTCGEVHRRYNVGKVLASLLSGPLLVHIEIEIAMGK
jgi:hypothetical protein